MKTKKQFLQRIKNRAKAYKTKYHKETDFSDWHFETFEVEPIEFDLDTFWKEFETINWFKDFELDCKL